MSGSGPRFIRSAESADFEAMWRGLPRKGLLPQRRGFEPRIAKQFLRNLLLVQAPSADDATLLIRLAGDAIAQQVLGNIVGQDFLDFVPEPHRKTRLREMARAMFSQPCGVWWIAPMYYKGAYSRFWELTAFPLAGDSQTRAAILVHALPFDLIPDAPPPCGKAVQMDVSVQVGLIAIDPIP